MPCVTPAVGMLQPVATLTHRQRFGQGRQFTNTTASNTVRQEA